MYSVEVKSDKSTGESGIYRHISSPASILAPSGGLTESRDDITSSLTLYENFMVGRRIDSGNRVYFVEFLSLSSHEIAMFGN